MGTRGPKPSKEPTTHIRVPLSIAEMLKNRAKAEHKNMPSFISDLIEFLKAVAPNLPHEGPPVPRGLGIRWPGQVNRDTNASNKRGER